MNTELAAREGPGIYRAEPQAQSIRPGYKQTEVGVIPEDWEIDYLESLFDISAGGDLDKEHFSPNQDDKYRYPIYANALSDDGLYGYSEIFNYGPEKITVTARGDVGTAVYRATSFNAIGRLLVLSPKKQLNLKFLSEYLNNYVEFALESTGVPQLTAPQISKYQVAFPPTKAEQEAIAEALSDADALIASLERLIAKKRQLKQGAMQELLTGKKRLPGFEVKHGYKHTVVGLIPEDWDIKFLPEVCRFRGGKAHEQYISNFGMYVCVNSKFISSEGSVRKFATANFCSAKRNDILMVMSDLPNGKALAKAFLADKDNYYAVNQRVCALTAYQDSAAFLFYVLNRNPYFLKFDDGVNQTHLLNRVFEKCPIALPPTVDEQTAIAAILSDMDADIAALEQQLAKARGIKQGMMQELLTGRVRLV